MCGFVGYLLPGSTPKPDLEGWGNRIAHRGPDSWGTAEDGPFGLSFRRLAIVDLSPAGAQPMHGERFILAFNGEIYNHAELRKELPGPWRGHSDSETILKACHVWGVEKTLSRLNGMYAIALWDKQSQELTLARDPLGVKPLLYLETPDQLYFGSELKALRPYTDGRLSRQGVALYSMFGFVPAPYSLLEGVQKLRPGEVRVFGSQPRRWFVTYAPWQKEGASNPGDLREAVARAVRGQLMSDVPVGIFLSGGVDSSSVAHIVAKEAPQMASFSLRPVGASNPEAELDADLAAMQAKKLGLAHHEIPLEAGELHDPGELLAHMDEPVLEPYFRGEVRLSQAAREAGVIVVLTGHGGDEVFMGYPTYAAVMKGEAYDRIPMLGPALAVASKMPFFDAGTRTNLAGAARVWRKPFLESYSIRASVLFSAEEAARFSGLPVAEVRALRQSVMNEVAEAAARLPHPGRELRPVELAARVDLMLNVPEHYNQRLDRASMSASVEARVPLQDLELLDFVLRLPGETLMQGGLKGLMKQAFAQELPHEVLYRPKRHFQAPVKDWLSGPLAGWAEEQFGKLSRRIGQPVRWQKPETGQIAYQSWSLALLEAWAGVQELRA